MKDFLVKFKDIPTAKSKDQMLYGIFGEGFILPNITDEQYNYWVDTISKTINTEEFAKERELRGLSLHKNWKRLWYFYKRRN